MIKCPAIALGILLSAGCNAQTIGLMQYDPAYADGYLLFSPNGSTHTYLVDRCGREVNAWSATNTPGLGAQFQPDGTLLRSANTNNPDFASGGRGGRLERFDWSGNLLWGYDLSNDSLCQHHDFTVLPNGNIMVIVWDRRDSAEAVAMGKDPAEANAYLWSEQLLELQPVGSDSAVVVWRWKLWDHIIQDINGLLPNYGIVSEHPELVDINFFQGPPNSYDWIHLNSVAYDPMLDRLLVSSHNLDEVWVIDHSTTTAEASSHAGGNSGRGGDLLFRWGNPLAYGRGSVADQRLFGQHHATWLPPGHPHAGKVLVFNNGNGRPGVDYSSLEIIAPPMDMMGNYTISPGNAYLPLAPDWIWTAPTPSDFYCTNISGVFPVADGYLVTDGPAGHFFQLDAAGSTAWQYTNPVNGQGPMTQGAVPMGNSVFRCEFYPASFAGFSGLNLTPGDEIELAPLSPSLCATAGMEEVVLDDVPAYPNPTDGIVQLEIAALACTMLDMAGRSLSVPIDIRADRVIMDLGLLVQGTYVVQAQDLDGRTHNILLVRTGR